MFRSNDQTVTVVTVEECLCSDGPRDVSSVSLAPHRFVVGSSSLLTATTKILALIVALKSTAAIVLATLLIFPSSSKLLVQPPLRALRQNYDSEGNHRLSTAP